MAQALDNLPPLNNADLDEVDGPQPPQGHCRVNLIQIKVPPFWKADPELRFLQIEAQFTTAGIRADLSKYNQIVGKLEPDTISSQ